MQLTPHDTLDRSPRRGHPGWGVSLFVIVALAAASAASAQPAPSPLSQVRVVAVAPISDEVGFRAALVRWTAQRLAERMGAYGVRVVPLDQAERALQEMGRRPSDLISLSATADLGRRLGADAVVTGRLLRADVEGRHVPPPAPGEVPEGPPEAYVTLDFRLLAVDPRRVLVRAEVAGYSAGFFALQQATELALRDFLSRLTGRP